MVGCSGSRIGQVMVGPREVQVGSRTSKVNVRNGTGNSAEKLSSGVRRCQQHQP